MSTSSIWIRTEPTLDGDGFMVVVETDEDHAFTLTNDDAFRHAKTLLWACAYAEYDASVYQQMAVRLPAEQAYQVVVDFQHRRAPLDVGGTAPFIYAPGLLRETREAVIQLRVEGNPVGLWSLDQARTHALRLIEATCVAQLDADYLGLLRLTIGLDEGTARAVVSELVEHRPAGGG